MWCADGGVVANNPSTFTLGNVLQSQVLQQQNKELSNVRLLSIGTGATIDYVPWIFLNSFANNCGMVMWLNPVTMGHQPAFPLMAAMFDGQAQIAHLEASNILGSSQYQRANPTLTQTIALDDCDAIAELKSIATAYIGSSKWTNIKNGLTVISSETASPIYIDEKEKTDHVNPHHREHHRGHAGESLLRQHAWRAIPEWQPCPVQHAAGETGQPQRLGRFERQSRQLLEPIPIVELAAADPNRKPDGPDADRRHRHLLSADDNPRHRSRRTLWRHGLANNRLSAV